jgi:DNA helicase-2/ATP-dependent DNA helicase PcrA
MRRIFGFGTGSTNYTIPSRFLSEISGELISGFYPQPSTQSATGDIFQDDTSWPPKPVGTISRSSVRPATQPGSTTAGTGYGQRATSRRVLGRYTQDTPGTISTSEQSDCLPFEHLSVGDVVEHTKFGIGTITQVIGEKDKELYNVEFKSAGKRLLDPRFAKLVKLN